MHPRQMSGMPPPDPRSRSRRWRCGFRFVAQPPALGGCSQQQFRKQRLVSHPATDRSSASVHPRTSPLASPGCWRLRKWLAWHYHSQRRARLAPKGYHQLDLPKAIAERCHGGRHPRTEVSLCSSRLIVDRRKSLQEQLFEQIRQQILDGRLKADVTRFLRLAIRRSSSTSHAIP